MNIKNYYKHAKYMTLFSVAQYVWTIGCGTRVYLKDCKLGRMGYE